MIRILAALAFVLLLGAQPARAQDAERLELAERLLELTQGETMRQSMRTTLEDAIGKSEMSAEERRWMINQMTTAFMGVVEDTMEAMLDDVARLFTTEELRAAVTLYETPEGRSFADKGFQFGVLLQQEMGPRMTEAILGVLEKYCAEFACPDGPDASK